MDIPKNKPKQLLMLLGCAAFVAIGFVMLQSGTGTRRWSAGAVHFFGYLSILFFGLIGLMMLPKLFGLRPAIAFTAEGFVNNSHAGKPYLVKWQNVKQLKIVTQGKTKVIAVTLKNDDEIYGQVGRFTRYWMKINSRMAGTPVFIPPVMVRMKIEEILQILRQQRDLYKKKEFHAGK